MKQQATGGKNRTQVSSLSEQMAHSLSLSYLVAVTVDIAKLIPVLSDGTVSLTTLNMGL